jgi:hypothetical protein
MGTDFKNHIALHIIILKKYGLQGYGSSNPYQAAVTRPCCPKKTTNRRYLGSIIFCINIFSFHQFDAMQLTIFQMWHQFMPNEED